mmetsp:Transcript_64/g.132  ORF Transcript_64/g.132 Transcript_64/m.132 type:complete len:158 (-) Transcript_64:882-1355(-)
MLPLLILVVPPTVIGGGYVSWSAGQNFMLKRSSLESSPPSDTLTSYGSGILTLGITYGLAEVVFAYIGGTTAIATTAASSSSSSSAASGHARPSGGGGKLTAGRYVPPKSAGDLLGRVGPPVLMRLGAASFAFFCAGAVQTYVASSSAADGPVEERK